MSCDWDVWCETCKDSLGLNDNNHGEDYVRDLLRIASTLADLGDAAAIVEKEAGEGVVVGGFYSSSYHRFNPVWFARHRGHDLRCKNEYGQFDTQCTERVLCPFGWHHDCELENGHAGAHGHKR